MLSQKMQKNGLRKFRNYILHTSFLNWQPTGTVSHSFKTTNVLTKTQGTSSITVSLIYSAYILPYYWCVVWHITSNVYCTHVFRPNIPHNLQLTIMMARLGTKTTSSQDMNWGECYSDLPCLSSPWVSYQ